MNIQNSIEQKLAEHFEPAFLEVTNESSQHNVPMGSETHFKVVLVSPQFDGERLLNRHRAVNSVLREEIENHIHALALHTYTGSEWESLYGDIPSSPLCMGGSARKAS
ncbi:transcriptional regulator BolA [Paraneptunicella aestuarii]|uniref:transcriptional regulator BolA n=1 Tax=Paraneptunicella aestuarii TaxID=2831148 RepID=UPI001E400CE0|nr:transcriptional regulator BolA [Paraneptunicella aestuarii]UAA39560.1 transcriptional regulator BolA [Paraneptunicella aestuarii]